MEWRKVETEATVCQSTIDKNICMQLQSRQTPRGQSRPSCAIRVVRLFPAYSRSLIAERAEGNNVAITRVRVGVDVQQQMPSLLTHLVHCTTLGRDILNSRLFATATATRMRQHLTADPRCNLFPLRHTHRDLSPHQLPQQQIAPA